RPAPPPRTVREERAAASEAKRPARSKRRAPAGRLARVLKWIFGALAALVVVGGSVWFVRSGVIGHAVRQTNELILAQTAKAGLKLREVTVEGRQRASREDLLTALSVHRGD